ncbi:MAG: DUF4340 domain-containing protein [Phycisphaerae bacterium]|nr:DUF4340 domain-containing protein [Phycisphaerae bacterium]HQE43969.1 DUF4340 domain-containing protein [Phycisphaerae bacterium]
MNLKTTLFLALAALVATLLWAVSEKPWKTVEDAPKKPETVEKALFETPLEGIDRVEVVLRDGERRSFKKEGDKWQMTEPLDAPANNYEVDQIVDGVTRLKYDRAYKKGEKGPSESTSGLNKPIVVKLYKGDELKADLAVGSPLPTGTGTYIRLAGTDEIRESTSNLVSTFNKRLDSYRDKVVVKFNTKDVRRIKVEGEHNYVLAKDGDEWTIESPVRGRADKEKANSLASAMSNLYAQHWQDDNPVTYDAFGLDRPRVKVTVETQVEVPAKYKPDDPAATRPADTQPSTETRTYAIAIGGLTGSATPTYFARLDSRPWVFSLAEYTVKNLRTPLADLQDKTLAKVEQVKVKKVEVQADGESMTLTRGDDQKWTFPDGTVADNAAVDDLIRAVAEMKATSFVNPADQGEVQDWTKPRARVSLTQEGRAEPITLLVGRPTPSGRMVYVRNAAEEPVAAVNEDVVAPLLLPPVSYRDRLVLSVPRERLSKIEIARKDAPAVTLVNRNSQWSLQSPIEAPADNDAVRNLLGDITTLQAKRVAGMGDKAKFGLDKPDVTLAVWIDRLTDQPNTVVVPTTQPAATQPATTQPAASTRPATTRPVKDLATQIKDVQDLLEYQRTHPETENKLATEMLRQQLNELLAQAATQPAYAHLATQPAATQPAATQPAVAAAATQPAAEVTATRPTGPEVRRLFLARKDDKTYVALEGSEMIWELDNRIYDDATTEMHQHQIVKFEVPNVVELSFEDAKGVLTFRKSGEEWRYVTDPLLPIDKQKVTDVLNGLREIKTHRYVDYAAADLAKYGLGDDAQRLVISQENGQRTEILLSKTGPANDTDKSRYAVVVGTKKVFLLKEDQARKFEQKLDDFVKSDKPAGSPTAALDAHAPVLASVS